MGATYCSYFKESCGDKILIEEAEAKTREEMIKS